MLLALCYLEIMQHCGKCIPVLFSLMLLTAYQQLRRQDKPVLKYERKSFLADDGNTITN
jgi:hypothetical protein